MNSQRLLLATLLLAGLMLASRPALAQTGISFSFANVEATENGLAFDVLAAGDAIGTDLGDTQIYLDYNEAAFGTAVKENGRITATLGPDLAANGNYYTPLLNDNTANRVSLVAEYTGQQGEGLTLTDTPVVLMRVTLSSVTNGTTATVAFHDDLMQGQQFATDFTTAFGVLVSDLLEVNLPLPLGPQVRAVQDGNDAVRLSWTPPDGAAYEGFELEHAEGPVASFAPVHFVDGAVAAKKESGFEHRLDGLAIGTHRFRVGQVDAHGRVIYSDPVEIQVEMVEDFRLDPAYPNPFNPQTTVRFAVREAGEVQMALYNAIGQRVKVLYDGQVEGNSYQTVRIDGSDLASGLYFVHLRGGAFTATQKVILMK